VFFFDVPKKTHCVFSYKNNILINYYGFILSLNILKINGLKKTPKKHQKNTKKNTKKAKLII